MKIVQAKYLGIYHNPFQYKQKHSLIFQNTKTKNYCVALEIDLEDDTKETIEEFFLDTYDVLLTNIYEDSFYEFESDSLVSLEKILEQL